jgi:hypothetical protein
VTNCDLVIISELAEELSVVCDGVMNLSWHLNGLTLLVLDEIKNVSLGLLHVDGLASNLDTSLSTSLAWDINRDLELRLEILLRLSTSANQRAVLVSWYFNRLDCLAISFHNDILHRGDDLVYNILVAFNLD